VTSLLDPFDVRARRAPSRVLFGPIVTNLGRDRRLTAAHVAFYRRRAAGGAGIVVVEEAAVHPSDHPYERSPLAERCGSGWAAIAAACAGAGSPATSSAPPVVASAPTGSSRSA
jgi:2,4-dienoyl-CoA reductase (NADPH2)